MAALMLFAAIEVMAQEQYCPSTCTAGPYSITFNGVSPSDCKDAGGNIIPCYDYSYSITGTTTVFNQAVALVPVCCDAPLTIYDGCTFSAPTYPCAVDAKPGDFGYNPAKIYPPGNGDPNGNFGLGIGMVQALRSEPAGTLPNPHIYASSPILGPISMQIKISNNYYRCPNIVGPRCPDCGVPGQEPSVMEKHIFIEGSYVKMIIDSRKCVQSLSLCDSTYTTCYDQEAVYIQATSSDGRLTDSTIREISDIDGNQRCAWGRIWMADSPGCTSIPSGGGRYYLIGDTCKCTSSTQCYPPKTCVKPPGSTTGTCK
jgi:hypothetical protein